MALNDDCLLVVWHWHVIESSRVLSCQHLVQALVRSKQIVKELEDVKISVSCCNYPPVD